MVQKTPTSWCEPLNLVKNLLLSRQKLLGCPQGVRSGQILTNYYRVAYQTVPAQLEGPLFDPVTLLARHKWWDLVQLGFLWP